MIAASPPQTSTRQRAAIPRAVDVPTMHPAGLHRSSSEPPLYVQMRPSTRDSDTEDRQTRHCKVFRGEAKEKREDLRTTMNVHNVVHSVSHQESHKLSSQSSERPQWTPMSSWRSTVTDDRGRIVSSEGWRRQSHLPPPPSASLQFGQSQTRRQPPQAWMLQQQQRPHRASVRGPHDGHAYRPLAPPHWHVQAHPQGMNSQQSYARQYPGRRYQSVPSEPFKGQLPMRRRPSFTPPEARRPLLASPPNAAISRLHQADKRPLSPMVNASGIKKSKGFDKLDLLCSATLEIGPLHENPMGCSCPKSKCVALYCDCFKAGRRCDPATCSCTDCKNTVAESGLEGARTKAIRCILARNPRAFTTAGLGNPLHKLPPGQVACNCIRSRCLKLYCSCFQGGKVCNPDICTCVSCLNTVSDTSGHRQQAIQQCLEKRPDAFKSRVRDPGLGCACKNNRCIRKYCECFRSNLVCSDKCSCRECANTDPAAMDHKTLSI